MRISVFQVDAFSNKPFRGNPAAACPLSAWLDDRTMAKVAAENNLSATAFFVSFGDTHEIRWFTPTCEARLCGHATLAAAFVLLDILESGAPSVNFQSRYGERIRVEKEDGKFAMDWPALIPNPHPAPPAAFLNAIPKAGLQEVLSVNSTYFAVYESEQSIRTFRPEFQTLAQLHPFAVSISAPGIDVDFVSRYFAPSYGVPEDPATGSAHCALTPYWSQKLKKTHMHARQISARGGDLYCALNSDRVTIAGEAVLTMQAILTI